MQPDIQINISSNFLRKIGELLFKYFLVVLWVDVFFSLLLVNFLEFIVLPGFFKSLSSFGPDVSIFLMDKTCRLAFLAIYPFVSVAFALYFSLKSKLGVSFYMAAAVLFLEVMAALLTIGIPLLSIYSVIARIGDVV